MLKSYRLLFFISLFVLFIILLMFWNTWFKLQKYIDSVDKLNSKVENINFLIGKFIEFLNTLKIDLIEI